MNWCYFLFWLSIILFIFAVECASRNLHNITTETRAFADDLRTLRDQISIQTNQQSTSNK